MISPLELKYQTRPSYPMTENHELRSSMYVLTSDVKHARSVPSDLTDLPIISSGASISSSARPRAAKETLRDYAQRSLHVCERIKKITNLAISRLERWRIGFEDRRQMQEPALLYVWKTTA